MKQEKGNLIKVDFSAPDEVLDLAMKRAIEEAAENLPARTQFDVRAIVYPDLKDEQRCRDWGIAWYWCGEGQNYIRPSKWEDAMPLRKPREGEHVEMGNYVLLGRLKTP